MFSSHGSIVSATALRLMGRELEEGVVPGRAGAGHRRVQALAIAAQALQPFASERHDEISRAGHPHSDEEDLHAGQSARPTTPEAHQTHEQEHI